MRSISPLAGENVPISELWNIEKVIFANWKLSLGSGDCNRVYVIRQIAGKALSYNNIDVGFMTVVRLEHMGDCT